MGVGGSASFDATLSDKAISEAIGQLVENIINKCTNRPWKTYIISCDNDGTLIAGGNWLEGGAVKPKAVESGSSLNP